MAGLAGEKRAMLPHLPGQYKRLKVPYFLSGNAAQSCFHSGFCITITYQQDDLCIEGRRSPMQQVPERHLDSATQPRFDELSRRYKVLLHATDVAARHGFPDLLQELSQLLRELFDFNFLNYAIRDDQADLMQVHMVDEELRVPDT